MAKIQATDYNTIQTKIAGILGAGSGTSGYGQAVSSGQVVAGNKIYLSEWLNLRTDLRAARQHQTGVDESGNLLVPTSSLKITQQLKDQYATYADTIIANKYAIGSGQFSTDELIVGTTKSGSWNGTIKSAATITGSATAPASGDTGTALGNKVANLRFFFNAGGTLRLSASRTGGSAGSKDDAWTNMLSQAGTISMNYTTTTYSGTNGTVYNIGYQSLTTTDQTIFWKPAAAGNYAENDFYIFAKKSADDSSIIFTFQFQDDDSGDQQGGYLPGPSVDENVNTVTGSALNAYVKMNRPFGSYVTVLSPTGQMDPIV